MNPEEVEGYDTRALTEYGGDEFSTLDRPTKREVKAAIDELIDDWHKFEVGEISRHGQNLRVELDSVTKHQRITVEIDNNP